MGVSMVLLGSLSSLGYGPLANVTVIGMQFLDFFDFPGHGPVLIPIAAICFILRLPRHQRRPHRGPVAERAPSPEERSTNAMIRFLCPFFAAIILISSIASAFGWISM